MKFQKRLACEAPNVLIREEWHTSLIKYKILKKHIGSIDCSTRTDEHFVATECPICMESDSSMSRTITTKCGHCFHPYCLIRSLEVGPCNGCPLCRRQASELMPNGFDGDCLQFLAMVQINTRAVQSCHAKMMGWLESELARLQSMSEHLTAAVTDRTSLILAEAEHTLLLLDTTLKFAFLNYEGLRKILKKFDKRTGMGVSAAALADLDRCGFAADAAAAGNGRCAALRAALHAILCDLRRAR